ncbi:hypothetical protein [Georgenia faecalis]|uniref:Uncharacterized protein n=1 Tax=Georgenia faecalis TaxID=2483799 RepID=A0ABV9D7K5_9MICO|nr:hypothetical protein [Georgenia faecalis]
MTTTIAASQLTRAHLGARAHVRGHEPEISGAIASISHYEQWVAITIADLRVNLTPEETLEITDAGASPTPPPVEVSAA